MLTTIKNTNHKIKYKKIWNDKVEKYWLPAVRIKNPAGLRRFFYLPQRRQVYCVSWPIYFASGPRLQRDVVSATIHDSYCYVFGLLFFPFFLFFLFLFLKVNFILTFFFHSLSLLDQIYHNHALNLTFFLIFFHVGPNSAARGDIDEEGSERNRCL